MATDDIEISHADGKTIIKGIETGKIRDFRDRAKGPGGGDSYIPFRKISKIDVLKPDGTPNQTIFGEPKPED